MPNSANYARGDISAPEVYEIRLPGRCVIETRLRGASIAELQRIAHENGVAWAECETISGFYSWCLGRAEDFEAKS